MKAIVTNIILGSLASAVSMGVPVRAEVTTDSNLPPTTPAILSATLQYDKYLCFATDADLGIRTINLFNFSRRQRIR